VIIVAINGWDLSNYIMSSIAIIGPCLIAWWFIKTATRRVKDFSEESKK
jgi:hypothetical protein